MALESYSRPTCDKLCASSNYASVVVGAIQAYKLDRRRVYHRLAVAKFSKSRVWVKVPEEISLTFRCYTSFRIIK